MPDARLNAPSTARNREPILSVLQRVLPAHARVLEIASGAGEHAVFFAKALPGVVWQPSDPDENARASIAAWTAAEAARNVLAPLAIDVRAADWGIPAEPLFDALVAINMVHISPWEATLGLFAGANRHVRRFGYVFLYGPYTRGGVHTAPSNEAFDASLKARDPSWGVRDISAVEQVAAENGFSLNRTTEMPANNFVLEFVKAARK
jgi:cyclopropane fatty-acyl-phospholipid synthase-like methyltransferase